MTVHNPVLTINKGVARNPLVRLQSPVSLTLNRGEQLAIVGGNGSGKSLLVDMLTGKSPLLSGELRYDFSPAASNLAYDNIRYIAFRDSYAAADSGYYYQQRWNSQEMDDVPLVADYLTQTCDEDFREQLYTMFGLHAMLDKKIVLLSSGELRKFQLVKNLLCQPRLLIVDNPYIGLDHATRQLLTDLFEQLTSQFDIQIILLLSMLEDIPPFITHVVTINNLDLGEKVTRQAYLDALVIDPFQGEISPEKREAIAALPVQPPAFDSEEVVRLNAVSIRYGERTILKALDWVVQREEHWALSGDNGAGKSTLLSLVCDDNPQSYACDISLFGRKRGSGESIWQIKKHIGYVSPEMHRSYQKNVPAIDIVASGMHDSIGLYVKVPDAQKEICRFWLTIFGIERYENTPFLQLSSGEQRLVLLARAFVKDPDLLILDEPLHGLDTYNRQMVKSVISAFLKRPNKTLIMVTHYKNELPPEIDKSIYLVRNG